MNRSVLVVEDDNEIRNILESFLSDNNCSVDTAADGNIAEQKMKANSYDLIFMDLMLPFKSGEVLIKEYRKYSDTPVIVLSARSMLETRLEVLRIGADDYILKPFDLSEVLVRMEVVLRRSSGAVTEAPKALEYRGLKLYTDENRVIYGDKEIPLTAKELTMLKLFLEYPQKVYTKANLYESVWEEEYCYGDNTINVHMSNLRSKLKKASGEDFIDTVWGIGYRLKEK